MSKPEVRRRSDQIFQLSLSELTLIILFLLLILAGAQVRQADRRAHDAERSLQQLAQEETHDEIGSEQRKQIAAFKEVAATLGRSPQDPDAVISELVAKRDLAGRADEFLQTIRDLNGQLTALEAVTRPIDAASVTAKVSKDDMLAALAFRKAFFEASGKAVDVRNAVELGQTAAKMTAISPKLGAGENALQRENRDLRGQLSWLRSKNAGSGGGRDDPPCWAEEQTGKPQYLLEIVIQDNGLNIRPAWPPEREREVAELRLDRLLAPGVQSTAVFRMNVQALDQWSRERRCRHYVRLANRVKSLDAFNRARFAVEEYFYKYEVR